MSSTGRTKRVKAPADPVPSEHAEQVEIFKHADKIGAIDDRWNSLYATPNGESRGDSPKTRAIRGLRLRAEGVRPGVPDLFLPEPVGDFHGLYIELKKRRGGKVSDDQVKWKTRLQARRFCVVVCKGSDEAIDTITMYLAGRIRLRWESR